MNTDFNILVKKIESFRNKFFLFQFLRGLLIFLIVSVVLFVAVNLLEYSLYLSSEWRRILFLSSVLFSGIVFIRYVGFTGLQLSGLIKTLSNKKASEIIRLYLPEVRDKIINVIELHELTVEDKATYILQNNAGDVEDQEAYNQAKRNLLYSHEIAEAAVHQKIDELKIFDFRQAVNIRNLKNLFFYFAGSFLFVVLIHLFNTSLFVESGNRIIRYNQQFVKPAPYQFIWDNQVSGIEKGNNFTIKLECDGTDIPSVIYVNMAGNNFLMKSAGSNLFEYELVSVIQPIEFYFTDMKHLSVSYRLEVIPVPVINGFTAEIVSPVYTGKETVRLENIGDMKVPKGSTVKWNFEVFDTDSLMIIFNGKDTAFATNQGKNSFLSDRNIMQPTLYDIQVRNLKTAFESVMNFRIDVVEDMFPEIKVTQIADSTRLSRFYFMGLIHDDYGFSNLKFHLNMELEDSSVTIPFNRFVMPQEFYYSVDMQDYTVNRKQISYYFSVTDNDGVNGPKTTTSESYTFVFPDRSELSQQQSEEFVKLEELLQESQQIANELREDIRDMQLNNMNSNLTNWEKTRMAESLLQKKNLLEQKLDQIDNTYKNLNNFQNTYTEQSQEILQKQEQIQELLDDVLTDELKKLLDEFSKLAEEFNDQRLNQLSRQMDMSFEDLSKQLERNLQMLKRLKIEQNLENIISQIQEMKELQEKTAREAAGNRDLQELQNDMIRHHEEMEQIEKDLSDILEENSQLSKPMNFDPFENEFNDIKENIRNSLQELQQNNRRNSSRTMQNTSEKLKNLAFNMQQMLNSNTMQENMENIQNLKQILKNLLVLSFEQENVLRGISRTSGRDPLMTEYTRSQRQLIVQSEVIKDSLYALAGRAPQIGNVVNNELLSMSINMDRSSELLNEGLGSQSLTNQQFVITAANNLTLMLSDVLQQIENQMNSMQDGEGEGQPGQGGRQMGQLQQQAESLKEQLQRMIDNMKNGNQPMSREMSESLMMHEMMQQMLRELMNSGSIGDGARKQFQDIDRILEQNRRDIMNKNVNPDMVRRHNEIMTRLLEAERSEMERDQDNKRESNTADEQFYSNPARFFKIGRASWRGRV